MDTILLKAVHGSKIEHNSIIEKDLSSPVNLDNLFAIGRSPAKDRRETTIPIPQYLEQDYNVEYDPLYKYIMGDEDYNVEHDPLYKHIMGEE